MKISNISISKYNLINLLILPPIIIYNIINAISSKKGDASTYQRFFKSFINTGEWPYGSAGGGERTFVLVAKISSLLGEYGLVIILGFLIVYMTLRVSNKLKLKKITPLLFCLSFFIPYNTITLHLCTSWRTSVSIFTVIFFIDYLTSKEKTNYILAIFLFLLILFSHTSGVIFITSIFTIRSFLIPTFRKIIKLKIRYNYIIYFIAIFLIISLIAFPILSNSSYIWTRIGEYYKYDPLNQVKSYNSYFIKNIILILSELYLFKSCIYNDIAQKVHSTLCLHYCGLLLLSFVVPVLITDRAINSIYWLTLICLIDILYCRFTKSIQTSNRLIAPKP